MGPTILPPDCDTPPVRRQGAAVPAGHRAQVKVPGERTSLKERAGVKRGSACSFALAKPFAGIVNWPRVSLSRAAAGPCAREAPSQGPGFSPAGLAGAAGVLDAGDCAPIIGAAGKGHAGAGAGLCGCGSPMAGCGRAGPRGCIHPFADPRHACRGGAWGGYAAGRPGSITRGPRAAGPAGGRCPVGAVRCAASRPAAGPVQVMRPVPGGWRGGRAVRACCRRPG
jgi:hypothetical protein